MKEYIHKCSVCQNYFKTTLPHASICSAECRKLHGQEYLRLKRAMRKPAPPSENMKEYYAYCEANGFVTYGKFQAIKTTHALKEQRGDIK